MTRTNPIRLRVGRTAGLLALLAPAACSIKVEDPATVPFIDVIELAEFSDTLQDYGISLLRANVGGDSGDELLIGSPATASSDDGLVLVCSMSGLEVLGALYPWTDGDDGTRHHCDFGRSMVVADFDHDGRLDVAVGDPRADQQDVAGAGEVWYFPGPVNATVFRRLTAESPTCDAGFGATLAQGDFDGDGWTDLAVAAPGVEGGDSQGECVTLFFGPDLTRCETRNVGGAGTPFGVALTALPAQTGGDAYAQPLLAGAPQASDGDRTVGGAFAFSGETEPLRLEPSDPGDAGFGAALELGNFSAAGTHELAVLANEGGGALYLYDAARLGAPRRIALPTVFANRGGAPVRCFGDVSRDGADELVLLSATHDDPAGILFSPGHGAAHLCFDFAAAAALVGNVDGDSDAELLLSTPTSLTPAGGYAFLRMVDFSWRQNVDAASRAIAKPLAIPGAAAHPTPYAGR